MKPLSINKALQLYKILAPHFPEDVDDSFNFVGKIIDNINNSGNHKDYTDSITLMTEKNLEYMKNLNSVSVLEMFLSGLLDNKLLLLIEFCKKVEFNA